MTGVRMRLAKERVELRKVVRRVTAGDMVPEGEVAS